MKLTDAEREALLNQMILEYGEDAETWKELGSFRRLSSVVESIVAARLEQQREELAAAIEQFVDDLPWWGPADGTGKPDPQGMRMADIDLATLRIDAARIVREYQPREGT